MEKISTEAALENAIFQLENQRVSEGRMLKTQFNMALDSIKPINLLKSTFEEVAESQALKGNILNTGIGLVVGYLSKVLFQGVAATPLKNVLGTAVQLGVTNVVSKHAETIKALGASFFRLIRRKTKDDAEPNLENPLSVEHF